MKTLRLFFILTLSSFAGCGGKSAPAGSSGAPPATSAPQADNLKEAAPPLSKWAMVQIKLTPLGDDSSDSRAVSTFIDDTTISGMSINRGDHFLLSITAGPQSSFHFRPAWGAKYKIVEAWAAGELNESGRELSISSSKELEKDLADVTSLPITEQ